MTNREYLNTLSDEKLANFLSGSPTICDEMEDHCNEMGDDYKTCCKKCTLKWLKMKRHPNPKKGDVLKVNGSDSQDQDSYYMVVKVQEKNTKIMTSTGNFLLVPNSIFVTDELTDMTAEDFLKTVVQNM